MGGSGEVKTGEKKKGIERREWVEVEGTSRTRWVVEV